MSTRLQAKLNTTSTSAPFSTLARAGVLQRKWTRGKAASLVTARDEERQKWSILQRRGINEAEPATVPPIVQDVLRSPGQPLDMETRAFMEPRFGHDFSRVRVHTAMPKAQSRLIINQIGDQYEQEADCVAEQVLRTAEPDVEKGFHPSSGYGFSQVRVHTGKRAAESAQALNARSFTIGRDVVFGAGQYAPKTNEGQRLIAHELTHVLQQNSITNTGITHTSTFANRGSYVQRAVSNQMSTIRDNLTYGIFDWAIRDAEAHEVLMILKNLNDTDLADTVAVMEQEGLVDRLFDNVSEDDQNREVDTLERIHRMRVHISTERHGETEVTTTVVGPCNPEQMHLITRKTEITKDWARRSKERVDDFVSNPATNATVANLLDTYFLHQANVGNLTVAQQQSHARQIRDNLETVEQQNNPFSNYCASRFDPLCRAMAAAYVSRSSRRVTFCTSFFASSSDWQTFALFHELMHAYAGVDDRGYGNERIFAHLSPIDAINNADSYALFVVDVLSVAGGTRALRPSAPVDRYADCNDTQMRTLQRDFAFASRMVLNALNILPDTRGIGAAQAMTHFKTNDPVKLARFIRRFRTLNEELSSRISFECEDSCDSGVTGYYYRVFGTTVHICPAYFNITSDDDREDEILLLVVMEELGMRANVLPGTAAYTNQSENQAYDNAAAYIGYAREITNVWWP
ncbi:MAG: DUF4157 domain-containing protein [Desulfobacteraceae bacterium]|nr:DUF4157 domain-containing protein [Desulfobacteraceae bacterium]